MSHERLAKAGKPLRPIRSWRPAGGECAIEGCSAPRRGAEYCSGHEQQLARGRDPRPTIPKYAVVDGTKFCKGCERTLPLAEFYAKLDNASPRCRPCTAVYKRAVLYGISLDEARRMLATEACDCCGSPFAKGSHQYMDHCHDTGRVRGVLCQKCNTALGCVGDSVDRLERLIAYLGRS